MNDRLVRTIFGHLASPAGRRILQHYQSHLLHRQVIYAAARSPFYRARFAQAGIDPRSIQSIADLPRLGFFTLPQELQADPFRFLSVPRSEILYAMTSSGTTGEPKVVFFTRAEWRQMIHVLANSMAMMGFTSRDVGQIMFCFGTTSWMTGTVISSALEHLGAFVLPTGNAIPVEKQIETMRRFGATILFGTPSYLHRLTEETCASTDLRALGIRVIRLGAEPWSESLRAYLEQAWGAQVLDSYGMIELGIAGAGEYTANGGLYINPYILVEVIDPVTGLPLPEGAWGELVFTPVGRQASPLLRYRSGDLGRLLPSSSAPSNSIPTGRLDRIQGRVDDMLLIGSGENVYPAQFETALLKVPGLTNFQVVIEKAGYQDRLRIRAELPSFDDERVKESLRGQVVASLYHDIPFLDHEVHQSRTILAPEVEFLRPGVLQQEAPTKLRRLVDRRERQASSGR